MRDADARVAHLEAKHGRVAIGVRIDVNFHLAVVRELDAVGDQVD